MTFYNIGDKNLESTLQIQLPIKTKTSIFKLLGFRVRNVHYYAHPPTTLFSAYEQKIIETLEILETIGGIFVTPKTYGTTFVSDIF